MANKTRATAPTFTATRARIAGAALAAALLTAGCAVERIDTLVPNDYSDLPESADVETAPYPLLVDNPARLETQDAQARIARGDEINADLDARAAALETEAALLLRAPNEGDALARRAAETRAAGAALAAEE